MRCLWNNSGKIMGHLWEMFRGKSWKCMGKTIDNYKKCMEHLWEMYWTCIGFSWEMHGTIKRDIHGMFMGDLCDNSGHCSSSVLSSMVLRSANRGFDPLNVGKFWGNLHVMFFFWLDVIIWV